MCLRPMLCDSANAAKASFPTCPMFYWYYSTKTFRPMPPKHWLCFMYVSTASAVWQCQLMPPKHWLCFMCLWRELCDNANAAKGFPPFTRTALAQPVCQCHCRQSIGCLLPMCLWWMLNNTLQMLATAIPLFYMYIFNKPCMPMPMLPKVSPLVLLQLWCRFRPMPPKHWMSLLEIISRVISDETFYTQSQ